MWEKAILYQTKVIIVTKDVMSGSYPWIIPPQDLRYQVFLTPSNA
jgi:hypothetical protein